MNTLMERLEHWLEANLPEVREDLAPGCSEAAITDFESQIGRAFPENLKALYRLHDGQRMLSTRGLSMALLSCHWRVRKPIGNRGKASSINGHRKK